MSWSALALGTLVALLPLETTASPVPVRPTEDAGFAYLTLLGGFFGVGLIMVLYILVNLKPKRRQPYSGPND